MKYCEMGSLPYSMLRIRIISITRYYLYGEGFTKISCTTFYACTYFSYMFYENDLLQSM